MMGINAQVPGRLGVTVIIENLNLQNTHEKLLGPTVLVVLRT